jgi:ATP-dependent Clp protease ATP-binding subunit ClpC
MNEVPLKELKVVVERVVRPVRATMARKRKMREELLAHLMDIFEEEAENLGDEQAALDQAKQRFGAPKELTTQLQQAVPRWDRWRSVLENMGYRPDEPTWHLAAKHFLVMLTIYAAALLALPILLLAFGLSVKVHFHFWRATLLTVIPIVLFNATLSLILASLVNKIGPSLAGKRWGRILLLLLCGLVLPFAFSGVLAGATAVFILMACQAVKEERYKADWA